MSIKNFSAYSLEGGLLSIDEIINQDFTSRTGMAFITDLNTLSGIPEFVSRCEEKNIKPVLGVTLTVREDKERLGNITLYAKNENGFNNLKKIVSSIVTTQNKEKFVSFDQIINNSKDLIALTGGYDSILYNAIKDKNKDRATKHLYALRKCFNEDFYFEIQKTNDEECDKINQNIINLSKKGNVSVFATNNNRMRGRAHYPLFIEKAIVSKGINNKLNRFNEKLYLNTDYIKKREETEKDFEPYKDDISSLKPFLNSFEQFKIFVDIPKIPDFPGIDNDNHLFDVLTDKYREFIKKIPADKKALYDQRIKEEVDLVKDMGFEKYFVIFLEIANSKIDGQKFNLRGSAASFLMTHVLGLSDVDPVKHGLLSERFLNKNRLARLELPDLDLESNDIDACAKFLVDKYGIYNTAYLSSTSSVKSKTQIKIAMKALQKDIEKNPLDANGNERQFPEEEFKLLNKVVTNMYGHKDMTFAELYKEGYVSRRNAANYLGVKGDWNSREFKNEYYKINKLTSLEESSPNMKAVMHYIRNLDAAIISQNISTASIVVSNEPISNHFSTHFVDGDIHGSKKNIKIAIESGKHYIEKIGLVKLDILSNLYLRKLSNAYSHLGLDWNEDGRYDEEYSNKEVFDMIASGRTATLNQINKPKQGDLAKELKVSNFSELVALLALIRPGVGRESIDTYIKNKENGNIQYSHPVFKEILDSTYGVLVFEEQIMEIAQKIGGFSKEESDDFRSIVKKVNGDRNKTQNKNYNKLEELKKEFCDRASSKMNMPDNVIKEALDILNNVGGYTFSKAHSLSYSALTYKQALIDVAYPAEYIQHFLISDNKISDQTEFQLYIDKTVDSGRFFLPLDINRSNVDFKTRRKGEVKFIDPSLMFSTCDENLCNIIVKAREDKKFDNLYDFVERTIFDYTDKSSFDFDWMDNKVNVEPYKNSIRKLIKSGAFDAIAPSELKEKGLNYVRTSMLSSLDDAVRLATRPLLDEDFVYTMPETPLTLENIKNDEKQILGYSPTELKEKPKKKKLENNLKNEKESENNKSRRNSMRMR